MKQRKVTIQPHVIPAKYPNSMKKYSSLILKGKWLLDSGFNPGDVVFIKVQDNRIVIERSLP